MKLSNLKIAARLYLGFGAVVAVLVTLFVIAYANFARLGAANNMNIHTYQVLGAVDGALASLIDIETGERGFALTGQDGSLEPYKAGKEAFGKYLAQARTLTADNPAQQARLEELSAQQRKWVDDVINQSIALRRQTGDADMAPMVALMKAGKGKKLMDAMRAQIATIKQTELTLLEQRQQSAQELHTTMAATLVGGGVVATVLAALVALSLARNITAPLRRALDLARQVAQGDLTAQVRVESKDETGELMAALKDMNASLLGIVTRVRTGTDAIATASSEIAAGNQDLSSRTEQQASSLEETASSMEELTSTVKQNADNARTANQLAAAASGTAAQGGMVVSQVVQTMGAINESASKIVDIISVIDGIAFQTNILALNAAVEAARAGEQGRGFAVVASEVRNLAQRSAAAAKEIKVLITDSVEKVEAGSRLVDRAGSTMEEVVASVKRVSDIIGEIAAASEEQRSGIEQVNEAINQMDQVTQQNAALVEEASAAAEAMQEQAAGLAGLVGTFRVDERAQGAAAARPALARKAAPPALAVGATRRQAASSRGGRKEVAMAGEGEWESF
ncbi:methyl-accepting chemotaxis protein [Massilia solisilvae]|uniref:Methyl-accepting chemotaxis protein n=1 Tax=Massilia solisilvae TaxID=1811225 RepID=A0ABT2BPN4_9BURK|nr:methyl-accepting chemotaxis protein [Massilia solisilvae]